jgi:hypothetical protein
MYCNLFFSNTSTFAIGSLFFGAGVVPNKAGYPFFNAIFSLLSFSHGLAIASSMLTKAILTAATAQIRRHRHHMAKNPPVFVLFFHAYGDGEKHDRKLGRGLAPA